jgi:anti-sigma regulatory factor (Ser/Thr protein kinase)
MLAKTQPPIDTGAMLISALAIPGHPAHVRVAREFTALVLGAHSRDDDGIAALLVSELITNSLRHSASGQPGGTITVIVAVAPGEALIEVTDNGGTGEPEGTPALTCRCGLTTTSPEELDTHFLRLFARPIWSVATARGTSHPSKRVPGVSRLCASVVSPPIRRQQWRRRRPGNQGAMAPLHPCEGGAGAIASPS